MRVQVCNSVTIIPLILTKDSNENLRFVSWALALVGQRYADCDDDVCPALRRENLWVFREPEDDV